MYNNPSLVIFVQGLSHLKLFTTKYIILCAMVIVEFFTWYRHVPFRCFVCFEVETPCFVIQTVKCSCPDSVNRSTMIPKEFLLCQPDVQKLQHFCKRELVPGLPLQNFCKRELVPVCPCKTFANVNWFRFALATFLQT